MPHSAPSVPRAPTPSERARALSRNIRHLCGFHPSIASVCRELGINRQQFNKYLSGSSQPSLFVVSRIARFFGVNAEDLFLPHDEFRGKFDGGSGAPLSGAPAGRTEVERALVDHVAALSHSGAEILRRYAGYYFRYYYDFDTSGRVVRSLFRITEREGLFLSRLIERVQHRSNTSGRMTTFKYDGVLVALSGCLFNVELESLMRGSINYAAFPCIPRPGQRFIAGIQSSFSSYTGRPAASRVVLERIDQPARLRQVLRRCGTFAIATGNIEPEIVTLISNQVLRESELFSPITL